MYNLIRKIFFLLDAEKAHYLAMNSLKCLCNINFVRKLIKKNFSVQHPSLQRNHFGLTFSNPVGLGAGFDKNAMYLRELDALGFGAVEIGTITPKPQDGNDKPRLFRLPQDKALINRMGFNNEGLTAIKNRLIAFNNWKKDNQCQLIIGGNIGKNKVTENIEAWKDYVLCFNELKDVVDYFIVNVSSPNTPGLRELQEKTMLTKIFSEIQAVNLSSSHPKPLLLKIAPDLTDDQLNDIVDLAFEQKLDGLVISNTTIERKNLQTNTSEVEAIGAGGLSGKPVTNLSNYVLNYISKKTQGKIVLIGSGGIFTADDAKNKINLGASMVQVWTGFIYQGPSIAKQICQQFI